MESTSKNVVIVTGAGSGIGRALSVQLNESGYRVVLVGRRQDKLDETAALLENGDQSDWVTVAANVTSAADRQRITNRTIESFGRIDALVNNAALGTSKLVGDLSSAEIQALFEVNSIGPIELTRLTLPSLLEHNGCVVNIGSVAMIDPFVGLGVYGCSKAAIDGFTRALHNEYNHQGIRAYTIAPGAVETDMLRSIVSKADLPSDATLTPEKVADKILRCITDETDEPSGSSIVIRPGE